MPPRSSSAAARLALAALGGLAAGCTHLHPEEELRLGADVHAQLSWQLPMLEDELVRSYVSAIGDRIVRAAGPQPFAYRFFVVVSPELNAFAAPAGHVYVHTGTVLACGDVSELAAVLAHEVGHVAQRHLAENYERRVAAGRAQRIGSLAAGLVAGPAGAGATSLLGGLTSVAVLNSFSRDDEREADAFAVEILSEAGYDPEGLVSFFRRLVGEGGAGAPAFLSSHPDTEARVREVSRALAEGPPDAELETRDGGRLEIIQRRIRLLTGEVRPSP